MSPQPIPDEVLSAGQSPLPAAALAQHVLVLGKTRSGKSSKVRLLVEGMLDESKPVCIIDPKGDWWGLKSSADGKQAGYPVIIFGGEHADVPINEHSGAHIAELIATGNRPCIIDLGGWMVGARTRFFVAFAEALFKLTRGPRWLVIDECHNFAPQGRVLDPDAGKMLHWANRLASEGAGKGLTLISASQRPQKVHKDYVTSHETLIACRAIHPLDRNATKDWIDGCADPQIGRDVLSGLAGLNRSQAFVWSPEIDFGPVLVTFPLFKTYDSFKPQPHDAPAALKGWAAVNLDEVKSRLAHVVEEATANDPKALKAEIATLRRDLATATRAKPGTAKPTPAPTPPPVIANAEAVEAARQAGERAGIAIGIARAQAALSALRVDGPSAAPARAVRASPAPREAPAPVMAAEGVTGPQQRILNALAWWKDFGISTPTNEQVGFIAGYSPSSGGFANLKSGLRSMGFVDYPAGGKLALTDAGAALADTPALAVTQDAFHAQVRAKLSGPQVRALDPIIAAYPNPISSQEVADTAGYSAGSGGFANLRSSLKTIGLIDYPGAGQTRAADWLFPGAN